MKTKKLLPLLLFLINSSIFSQELDDYIQIGLENNENLKQREFEFKKSLYALKEAKSLYYPKITLNGNYTRAEGGRTIDIPIGNLLNPVYNSLNQLTNSSNFIPLSNQSVLINPDNFYDAKIHTTFPIINFEILFNKKIKEQQWTLKEVEIDIYKRELIKEIKLAYFKFLQAHNAVLIYQEAIKLVKEGQRINTALFKNDKINRTSVLRSNNEVSQIEAKLEVAIQNKMNAQLYFNFIINQPLENLIQIEELQNTPIEDNTLDIDNREELKKINLVKEINSSILNLSNTYLLPKINGFIDVGYQDFDFQWTNKSRYYFAGISLEWNIFSGNRNKYKAEQILQEKNKIDSQKSYLIQQLKLQLQVMKNNFIAILKNHEANSNQVQISKLFYEDVLKLYKEGSALHIELLDAQNQWITAKLNTNISLYEAWIAYAEIERATASLTIKK